MVPRERDEETVGLTDMVLDAESEERAPQAKKEEQFPNPSEGESELPLDGE